MIKVNEPEPVQVKSLEESFASDAPNPFAPDIPEAPERQATADGANGGVRTMPPLAESLAAAEADEERDALRAKHSRTETLGSQFVRGALDALLAPGALVGLHYETAGKALNAAGQAMLPEGYKHLWTPGKFLEDFGRDIGRASTGRSALEATGALIGASSVFGDGFSATDAADAARVALDEQERAWPMLTTAARVGGGLAFGVTAGLSGGAATTAETGLAALAGIGATEGAAAGAQGGYEADAPITEIWVNAMMGAGIGASIPLGIEGAQIGARRLAARGDLAKVFGGEGSMLGEAAEKRAFKAVGGRGPEARRLGDAGVKRLGAEVLDARLVDGTPIIPKSALDAARMDQGELTERLARGMAETGEQLGELRLNASKFIDEAAPDLRPNMARLTERMETEILPQFDRAAPGSRRQAAEVRRFMRNMREQHGDDLSLEDFFQERLAIDRETNFNSRAPDVMKEVRRVMEDEIEQRIALAADRAGMASDYTALKRRFGALKQATEMSAKASGTDIGNRWLSLSDNMVGVATIAGDLASGGGLSLLKGAVAGFGHKILRERGSILQATLLNRFRRIPVSVDVAKAGGREAQDALTALMRAKALIQETAERAGPNANARASAQNTAQEAAAEALTRLAGTFDPDGWAKAAHAPSPVARVLYRSQILDAVSEDLAPTVGRTAAMRPPLDFDLDAAKLGRLTKDAQATDAIAAVQAKVREIADAGTGPVGQRPGEVARAARDIPTEEIPHEAYFGREPYHPERVDLDRVKQVGLQGSEYLRDGMRPASLDAIRKVEDLRSLGPARVSVDPDGNVALIDGRHRMTVAQERGEQTFLAKIIQTNGEGDAVGTLVTEIPIRPQGQLARPAEMEAALEALNTADPAQAMVIGHKIARQLAREGKDADARALQLTLGDDLFGQAGKTYRQMTTPPSETLAALADPKQLRDALRTLELRGQLSQQIAEEHRLALAAFDARKRLTGETVPPEIRQEMRAIEQMWDRAEESVTLDGTRLGRIANVLDAEPDAQVASRVPSGSPDQQVVETFRAALQPVESVLKQRPRRTKQTPVRIVGESAAEEEATGPVLDRAGSATRLALASTAARAEQYAERLERLAQAVVQPEAEVQQVALNAAPPEARPAIAQAKSQKLATLIRDMPKPRTTLQGTAYDSLSSEELRRGTAMWEATMDPMSVFEDFARGNVDPDKVAYAWKQYPGLQQMAQLGVLDVLQSQMTAEERSRVPGNVLTQLDYMLGFKGGLQNTVSFEFSQRISGIHEQLQQQSATPSPPSKGLVLPTSKPTMTQRIAGAQ